ncbi:MAG TPA: toprim domain-containing protein [Abditibacteriaceae bacterium]|jgi:hypothetical protein
MAGPVLSLGDLEEFDPHSPSGSRERRFLCPLCGENKPKDASHRSLAVNVSNGAWHCFRCDARGKLKDNWTLSEEKLPRQRSRARLRLQQKFALPPEPERSERSQWRDQLRSLLPFLGSPGEAYLARRGIPADVADATRLRYSPNWFGRPAVIFPIYDADGKLVAAQGRYIDGRTDPKARTAGARKEGVFATAALWDAVSKGAPVIVTEAPLDALSLAACGYPALALCGKDGWPRWLPIRCAFRRVAIAFDADEAGDVGAEKITEALASLGAKPFRLRPEGGKDWNELLIGQGREEVGDWLAIQLLAG